MFFSVVYLLNRAMRRQTINFIVLFLCSTMIACGFNFRAMRHSTNSLNIYEYEINALGQAVHFIPARGSIPIFYDDQTSPERVSQIQRSIEAWNHALGFDLFGHPTPGRPMQRYSIYISYEDLGRSSNNRQLHGLCRRYYQTNSLLMRRYIDYAQISIWDQLSPISQPNVIIHELGHAIGLGHDRFINSVMYPFAAASYGNIEQQDIDYAIEYYADRFEEDSNEEEQTCNHDYCAPPDWQIDERVEYDSIE